MGTHAWKRAGVFYAWFAVKLSGKIGAMTNKEEYIPKSAMSIHAHPDDQDFSVAGTIAKWASAGCEIISVILTSGDAGSNDPSKDGSYKPELARLRERGIGAMRDFVENAEPHAEVDRVAIGPAISSYPWKRVFITPMPRVAVRNW